MYIYKCSRGCAVGWGSRKVAGSIPDGVIGIFRWQSFRPHYSPGVDSASNRNEYQECFLGGKGGRCVGLTTLPPSCSDCLEIWESRPLRTLRACTGNALPLLTYLLTYSIVQSLSWEANLFAASQEIPLFVNADTNILCYSYVLMALFLKHIFQNQI